MVSKIVPIILMVVLFSSSALAWNPETECPPLPDDSLKAQQLAGELFNRADEYYKNHQSIDALKSFLCSHSILQHENTLFNIAQITKLNETREEALMLLKEYVEHAKGSNKIDPIQDIIDELEKRLVADGKAAEQTAEPEERSAEPDIEKQGTAPDPAPPQKKRNMLKTAGMVLIGVGGATLIAGAVFQGIAGSAKSDGEDATSYESFEDKREKMKKFQNGALIGFVAGGVLGGAGLVLYLIGNKRQKESNHPHISVVLAPKRLRIRGTF